MQSMNWIRTSEQLPTPDTEVLIAYVGGALYLGYWRKENSLLIGFHDVWRAYNVGGLQEVPDPHFWMYIPSIPN